MTRMAWVTWSPGCLFTWPNYARRLAVILTTVVAGAIATSRGQGQPAASPEFEKDILPVLTAHCLKCHGDSKPKARLNLTTPSSMLNGGESGPALVAGASARSLVFQMIRKGEMPPDKNKLTAQQVELLKAWIDGGAPVTGANVPVHAEDRTVTDEDRKFWAFQKPLRPPIPRTSHTERLRTPIDAFILAKLEGKGLYFSPEADRTTLLRRVTFDLIGLPPAPDEVETFLADRRPDAYERVVERLLSSPHYGERWGRHWLDAAGYSDSVGGDNDPGQLFVREGMWRYRDYVVGALNDDKPFDRFLAEQLAGDEMDDWRSAAVLDSTMREHLIATGLLRTSVDHTTEEELNRPFERYQVLHDTIENLTSNLLGLTVACARCHDHKFDPISQVEYYQLMAILKPIANPEQWIQPQNHHLPDVSPREKAAIDLQNSQIDAKVADLNRQIADIRRPHEKKLLETRLALLPEPIRADTATALETPEAKRNPVQQYLAKKLGPALKIAPEEVSRSLSDDERAKVTALTEQSRPLQAGKRTYGKIQAAWEAGSGSPPPAYVFRRGNHVTPGAEVQPAVFAVLNDPRQPTRISAPSPQAKTTGRRTELARWLTRPDHPLTARVFINRVWQHYFGEGIVATSDNFGHLGARPTHPELLDWLATQFVGDGWRTKALHRLIVTSTVYRQASAHRSGAETIDPGNQLLWRMRLRRLESEAVRDAVLAVSGRLDRTVGGPPIPIEPKTDGTVVVAAMGLPTPTAQWRRSLYLFARRNYNLTLLNVFDQPVMATNCSRRVHSAVPLQSLTLLNDALLLEQAEHFAARVAAESDSPTNQVASAFRLAFGRNATAQEIASGVASLRKLENHYHDEKLAPADAQLKALARLCHMLMCANEFLYVG